MDERAFILETRLMHASPVGTVWTGAAVWFLCYGVFLACAAWSAVPLVAGLDDEIGLSDDAWTALCMSLLWWSILSFGEYARRGGLADAVALQSAGVPVDTGELKTLAEGPSRAARRRAAAFGAVGTFVGLVFFAMNYHPESHLLDPSAMTATNVWFLVMTMTLFMALFRRLSFLREDTAAFIRDGGAGMKIDLLDISKLDGFGRIALRGAVPWLVTGTLVLLMLLGRQTTELFVALIVLLVASAIVVFAWPMMRIHRLIADTKAAELARVRQDLAEVRRRFETGGTEAERVGGRLAALLSLETRIAQAREWPLDVPTAARFMLFLGIPLASWAGAGFVNIALEVLIA